MKGDMDSLDDFWSRASRGRRWWVVAAGVTVAVLSVVAVEAWWVAGWDQDGSQRDSAQSAVASPTFWEVSPYPVSSPGSVDPPAGTDPRASPDAARGSGTGSASGSGSGSGSGAGGSRESGDRGGPRGRGPGGSTVAPAEPLLTLSRGAVPVSANLSAEGGLDWIHWGLTSAQSVVRKRQPVVRIVDHGSRSRGRFDGYPQRSSWSDGSPVGFEPGTRTGLYACGLNNGFTLSVDASSQVRTLRISAGVYRARGRFTATLGGLSETQRLDSTAGYASAQWTIRFRAQAGGQLTVRWIAEAAFSTASECGNVEVQTATLS